MTISVRISFRYFLFVFAFFILKYSNARVDETKYWPEMVSSLGIYTDTLDLPVDSLNIPDAKQFRDYKGERLKRNTTYWIRLLIDNSAANNQNYFIHFNSLLSSVKLYQDDGNGNYTEKTGGTFIPEKERSVGGMIKEKVPFTISKQNKTELYLKICTQVELVYSLAGMEIVSVEDYKRKVDKTYLIQFFFLGVIILLSILSLSHYMLTRKRLYLFYLIYLFFNLLFFFNFYQITERYIFYNFPKIDLSLSLGLTIVEAVYLWFLYEALKEEVTQKWRKLIRGSAIFFTVACFIICIILPLDYNLGILVNDIYSLFAGSVVVAIFVLLYRKVSVPLKIILTGSLIVVTSGLIAIVMDFSKVVSSNMNLYQMGVIVEVILFSIALNFIFNKERLENANKRLLNSRLEAEKVKKDLENHLLADKLTIRNRELASKTVLIEQKESIIYEAIAYLAQLRDHNSDIAIDIQQKIKSLQVHQKDDNWKEFELHFRKINPMFYSSLIEGYPNLTRNDLKLCAFIKLNLSTKQIASITGKNINAIDVSRSRLRKKMGLKNGNLTSFITSIK